MLTAQKIVLDYAKHNVGQVVGMSLLSLVYPAETILTPIFFSKLVKSIHSNDQKSIKTYFMYLMIINLVTIGVNNVDLLISETFINNLQHHTIDYCYRYIFENHIYNVGNMKSGELASYIRKVSMTMADQVRLSRDAILPNFFSLFVQMIYMFTIDPKLGGLVSCIFIGALMTFFGTSLACSTNVGERIEQEALVYGQIDDIIINFTTIFNHSTFDSELDKLSDLSEVAKKYAVNSVRCALIYISILIAFSIIILSIYVLIVYKKHISNIEKTIVCVTILFEILNILKSLMYTIQSYNINRNTLHHALAKLTYNVDDVDPQPSSSAQTLPPSTQPQHALETRNLSYSYPESDEKIISDLNIQIPKGQITLLTGKNGSGKSTLLKLFILHHIPTEGDILLNGETYDATSRSKIGYIEQHGLLFNRSIRENITYSKPDITDQELEAYITSLQLQDFISQFPEGLQTNVGRFGKNISGGQRQICQIIRVIIQNPEIILMDEPTSSIDVNYKDYIIKLLQYLRDMGKTIVIISHDTVIDQLADNIINLEKTNNNNL
jgi:ABC-type multidrug transport system fused ATPase/permease subunit